MPSPPVTVGSLPALAGAALVLLACAPQVADAANFDPDLTWRTLRTEHFDIHFHQGEEQLADEVSRTVEDVWDRVTAELAWEPRRRTELVLVDRTDSANGYAMTLPYNTIVVYVTAPTDGSSLDLYEDWAETILTHELTHILHLDANHGLVRLARAAVGRVASTNGQSPAWVIEGMGTFQETRHTTGGRGRAPLADMIVRTAVVEDAFPPLGNLNGYQVDPPGGQLRYLFGQRFMQFVADTRGEDVWTRWTHTYGAGLPYLLPSRKAFGKRLVPLYFEWRDHLSDHYDEQLAPVHREGVREGRLVSDGVASCTSPAFSPDGARLVWSCVDRATGAALWEADAEGNHPRVLVRDRGARGFSWRADGKALVYSGSQVVNRFNVWSDVYLLDLETERVSALTRGARARDPEFSPDGSRLLVVTNRAQDNQLEVLTVDRRQQALTEHTDHTQYAAPRYSPDGSAIAVSMWQDGRRDLWLLDADATPRRRLTADVAPDRDPHWTRDGEWLFFSSDRSGIPNIYAVELDTERLYQVTNVTTGATSPWVSPDGTLLAYQQYSQDGWDVRILPLDPDRYLDRGLLPRIPGHDTPIRDLVPEGAAPPEMATTFAPTGDVSTRPPGAPPPELGGTWGPVGGAGLADRGAWGPTDPLLARQDAGGADSFDQARVDDAFGAERDYPFETPPRRYNPLPGLIPRYYLPVIQSTPFGSEGVFSPLPMGLLLSAQTASTDPLRFLAYRAGLSYRTDALFLGWNGAVTVNRYLPVYTFGARADAVPVGTVPQTGAVPQFDDDGAPVLHREQRYWERRTQAYATVSFPYSPRTTVFGSYRLVHRTSLRDLPDDTYLPALPMRGTTGGLSGGWRYSWSQPTAYAVSPEDARIFSLVGEILAPWLGTFVTDDDGDLSPLTQARVTSELREYVVNPWVPNHVLAMRVAGGLTVGERSRFGTYQLGGSFGDSAFYATPEEFRMVRGYPVASAIGDRYWLGGAEYRFPIWRIDRGVGTVPVFLRTLSGAVFVDAGNAVSTLDAPGDLVDDALVGVGAELRLNTAVFYRSGFSGRFGWAAGLTEGGYRPGDPNNFYFQIGGSF